MTAPLGGITSGSVIIVGGILDIAADRSSDGGPVERDAMGVHQLPKDITAVPMVGTRMAKDNTAKNINLPDTGPFPVGFLTEAAGKRGGGWMALERWPRNGQKIMFSRVHASPSRDAKIAAARTQEKMPLAEQIALIPSRANSQYPASARIVSRGVVELTVVSVISGGVGVRGRRG